MRASRVLAILLVLALWVESASAGGKHWRNKDWFLSAGPFLEYVHWAEDVP